MRFDFRGSACASSSVRSSSTAIASILMFFYISTVSSTFFGNFVPEKPENTSEGISPNYNNPHKGYALPGTK
jgi:hypothetical protein